MTSALMKMEMTTDANVDHKNYQVLCSKTNTVTVAVLPHAKVLVKMSIAQMDIFKALMNHAI